MDSELIETARSTIELLLSFDRLKQKSCNEESKGSPTDELLTRMHERVATFGRLLCDRRDKAKLTGVNLTQFEFQSSLRLCQLLFSKLLVANSLRDFDTDKWALADYAFEAIGQLSRLNFEEMVNSWPLFLTDSFAEEKTINTLFEHYSIISKNGSINFVGNFAPHKASSPLTIALLNSSHRRNALSCLEHLMCSQSLSKWFSFSQKGAKNSVSEKIVRFSVKALKLCTIVLFEGSGHDLGVFQQALGMATHLISSLGRASIVNEALHSCCNQFICAVASFSSDSNYVCVDPKRSARACAGLEWLSSTSRLPVLKLHTAECLSDLRFSNNGSFLMQLLDAYSELALRRHKFCETLLPFCALLCAHTTIACCEYQYHALVGSKAELERLLYVRGMLLRLIRDRIVAEPETLLFCLRDENHRVRSGALDVVCHCCEASISLAYWGQVRETIMLLTEDSKSTVRSGAFRVVGELSRSQVLQNMDGDELSMIMKGCGDSSLQVRIQAMWALSKALFRQLTSNMTSTLCGARTCWLRAVSLSLDALSDSEKIHATALRAMSSAIAGHSIAVLNPPMSQEICNSDPNLHIAVDQVTSFLLRKYFNLDREMMLDFDPDLSIPTIASKDLFALTEIFSIACCWPLCNVVTTFEIDVGIIFDVLLRVLVCGTLQIRIVASRGLAMLLHYDQFTRVFQNRERSLLEALLVVIEAERLDSAAIADRRQLSTSPQARIAAARALHLRHCWILTLNRFLSKINESAELAAVCELLAVHISPVAQLLENASHQESSPRERDLTVLSAVELAFGIDNELLPQISNCAEKILILLALENVSVSALHRFQLESLSKASNDTSGKEEELVNQSEFQITANSVDEVEDDEI